MSAIAEAALSSRAGRVQRVFSPGGIEAWLVEDHAVPLVALEFSISGGASQDVPTRPGIATLLAGLLDEGAGPYDAEAFHRALDDKAIHLSFSADRDHFSGHMQTLERNTDAAFDLLRVALNEARLDPEPMERVREQMAAALKRDLNDPEAMGNRAFRAAAFPDHPYGRAVRGELGTLPSITRADLDDLRTRAFARATLKIAAVGALDAATLARHLDEVFGAWPELPELVTVPATSIANLGTRKIVDLDVPQTTIRFGRPGIHRRDPDFIPAMVVNYILGGGGLTTRLFHEVREKRGLAYSVYSQIQSFDRAAMLAGSTSTKNERAAESLAVIESEIKLLAREGPSEAELEKAKRYLTGSYALSFDTSTKIAAQLVHLRQEGFDISYLDERNKLVEAVTLAEAKRVGERLFGDGALLVTAVGRPGGM
ncbi:MAG: zinc protease [Methylobacteriaceae bacterium]|nr:zinc protease [Methylobacteriaceae bacterium]